MKLNKIVFPLALALAATLATTGCKHGFNGKETKLPGHNQRIPNDNSNTATLPSVPPFDAQPMPTPTPIVPGGTPTADIDLSKYDQDRETLKNYMVHFNFDSAVVLDKEQANIASVAQALQDQSLKLLVEGHCDERGTEQYNMSLGERRALALREALGKVGIDQMRVKTISYGKDKPADPGHNEAAWAKNRRGEFILLHPKPGVQ